MLVMTDRDPPSFIREVKKEPWACTKYTTLMGCCFLDFVRQRLELIWNESFFTTGYQRSTKGFNVVNLTRLIIIYALLHHSQAVVESGLMPSCNSPAASV